jgi:anti-sigma B factor antagonist
MLNVTRTPSDAGLLLVMEGDLDVTSYKDARQVVQAAVDEYTGGPPQLTIDISGLGYVDSVGLGMLLRTQQDCRRHGRSLTLICNNPRIMRVLQITGLTSTFKLQTTGGPAPPSSARS